MNNSRAKELYDLLNSLASDNDLKLSMYENF